MKRDLNDLLALTVDAIARNSFHWLVIAGLIFAIHGITNAPATPNELRHDRALSSTKLGLTDLPEEPAAPSSR